MAERIPVAKSIRRATSKDSHKVLDYAEQNGWRVEQTRSRLLKLTKSGASTVFHSLTPSCARAHLNTLSAMRREDRQIAALKSNLAS